MDKILLNNMCFYGYHGVLPEETKLGQKFFIDMEIFLDLEAAGRTDDIAKSISYAEVFEIVKEVTQGEPYQLIEALAHGIAKRVLSTYNSIDSVLVRVKKPEAPVPGSYDYFGVEIVRRQNG
ncbi:dihydroneopterin aldolase [Thiospirochaeta perfilievii]|uniref:7,8-dihydroneopterin aldolase n=1 Tax=Thiospirochaeta perfilievii TaxID=252967 RepID=A0A5C1Q974_9SPIO|nr:dihydroneopterin aldolase [Thiospirochaeta perfilievii]QEN04061.1 dihydroneopterin aldolase [Thiospirochaeta perfilievii]